MFAWFFISPLLKQDGIKREVNAVDSESKKNLLDDFLENKLKFEEKR